MTARVYKEICRFNVAVHHAELMSMIERLRGLLAQSGNVAEMGGAEQTDAFAWRGDRFGLDRLRKVCLLAPTVSSI